MVLWEADGMEREPFTAFRIKALNNEIKRNLDRNVLKAGEGDLTGVQHAVLGYLGDPRQKGDRFQRDIETRFNIRRSTATGILQSLEKKGYIVRVPVPEDARLKKILLTDRAKTRQALFMENMRHLEERMIRGISEEELEVFYRVMGRMTENIQR